MIIFSNPFLYLSCPMEINVSREIYADCMKKWTIADKDNRNSLGYTYPGTNVRAAGSVL